MRIAWWRNKSAGARFVAIAVGVEEYASNTFCSTLHQAINEGMMNVQRYPSSHTMPTHVLELRLDGSTVLHKIVDRTPTKVVAATKYDVESEYPTANESTQYYCRRNHCEPT